MKFIKPKLPSGYEINSVFGIVVFIVFGRSILGYLYKFPSFILHFGVFDLIGVFSYMMTVALLESLLVLGFLMLAVIILPTNWFNKYFQAKAGASVVVVALWMLRFKDVVKFSFPSWLTIGYNIGTLFVALIFVVSVLHYLHSVRDLIDKVTIQFQVFLYVYLPISLLSVLVVILRNLR